MPTRVEIAQQFLDAQRSRDAAKIDGLAASLADDVVLNTPRGGVNGRDALIDRLKNPPAGPGGGGGGGGMFGQITFGDPVEDGSVVKIAANIPPNPMIRGMTYVFDFSDADVIQKIDMQVER